MGYQYWTERDDEVLRGMYATEPVDVIAMDLERTQQAVRQRASILGLKKAEGWSKKLQAVT